MEQIQSLGARGMNFHPDESFGNHQEESWNQREDNVVTENKRPILEANSKGT